jgi:hypothetical protein
VTDPRGGIPGKACVCGALKAGAGRAIALLVIGLSVKCSCQTP